MLLGLIISTTGTTMVWPFLTVFASERLSLPMAAVTSLMSINSLSGLTASNLAGSLEGRFGGKSVVVVGVVVVLRTQEHSGLGTQLQHVFAQLPRRHTGSEVHAQGLRQTPVANRL